MDPYYHGMPQIEIPQNIIEWCEQSGENFNLQINYNNCVAANGYAQILFPSVRLMMYTRTCHRCGYDEIWNPIYDTGCASKGCRHSYGAWRYDTVFQWTPCDTKLTLESAFAQWEEAQPKEEGKAVVRMTFGRHGFT